LIAIGGVVTIIIILRYMSKEDSISNEEAASVEICVNCGITRQVMTSN
jgi:hypothetical protein